MSDHLFTFFVLPVALLIPAGIGLVFLVSPSLHFRLQPNPFMPDTPWNRLQMRIVGLVVCLFLIEAITGWSGASVKSQLLEGFSDNVLVALWATFIAGVAIGVISWISWRFSAFRSFIRSHYPSDRLQNRAWERSMALIFCSVLLFVVGTSLILAAEGHHP
jgi:hypothetical protein